MNLTYNSTTGAENVTLTINNKSAYINGTGDLSTDGANSTTFNLMHYYNSNSPYYRITWPLVGRPPNPHRMAASAQQRDGR